MKRKDIDTNRWRTVGIVGEDNDNFNDKKNESSKDKSLKKIKSRNESDSDLSPPRNQNKSKTNRDSDSDLSPPRNEKRIKTKHDSDNDLSPPRSRHHNSKKNDLDKDLSPPRIGIKKEKIDDDLSPPRSSYSRHSRTYDHSSKRLIKKPEIKTEPNDFESSSKPEATLSGKKAGLSDARNLKEESLKIKKKEEKLLSSISDEMSGKSAKTVFRDSKTGKIRNIEEEDRIKDEKTKQDNEMMEKYKKWNKGVKQHEQQQQNLESDLYEMTKPLARYEDDADLDKLLREKEREDDPMLLSIKKKKAKNLEKISGVSLRPTYNGPTPPPLNRFNIMPGYRWDGVDRSNGFEKRHFESINNRQANIEEAYKWSTEDM